MDSAERLTSILNSCERLGEQTETDQRSIEGTVGRMKKFYDDYGKYVDYKKECWYKKDPLQVQTENLSSLI